MKELLENITKTFPKWDKSSIDFVSKNLSDCDKNEVRDFICHAGEQILPSLIGMNLYMVLTDNIDKYEASLSVFIVYMTRDALVSRLKHILNEEQVKTVVMWFEYCYNKSLFDDYFVTEFCDGIALWKSGC